MDNCTTCNQKISVDDVPVFGIFRDTKFYFCSIDCAHNSNICMNLYIKKEFIKIKKDYPLLIFIDEDEKKEYCVRLNEKGKLSCLTIDSKINIIFKMLAVCNNPIGRLVSHIYDENILKVNIYFNDAIIADILNNGYSFTVQPRVEVFKK